MDTLMRSDELLSVREVADIIGCHPVTAYKNYARWGIPFVHVGGRIKFFRRDIEGWLMENRRVSA